MPATPTAEESGTPATRPSAVGRLDAMLLDRLTAKFEARSDTARAKLLGVDRASLYRWRTGRFAPNLTVAQRIAEQLGTTVDELFPRRAA